MTRYSFFCFVLFLFSGCNSNQQDRSVAAYLALDSTTLELSEIASGLEVPWDADAVVKDRLYFTEQNGSVYRIDLESLEKKLLLKIPDVLYQKSYGLLGMTVHPDESYLFVHYTFSAGKDPLNQIIKSRLVRYDINGDSLKNRTVLMDSIPGNTYHNGSRLVTSPDNKLFFSFGDIGRAQQAQNDETSAGKIMRFNLDGSVPDDNPVPGSTIWSRGHRNAQGLAFSDTGKLYASEHGPNNDDEINLIIKNGNYAWPDVQGFCDEGWEQNYCAENEMVEPLKSWTPTIAVAGLSYYNNEAVPEWSNSLIAANLKGRALRVLNLSDDGLSVTNEHIFFQKYFGRIRDVTVSPDGDIFFTTSNTDWHPRFQPWMYDSLPEGQDRILRLRALQPEDEIDPKLPVFSEDKEALELMSENWNHELEQEYETGRRLYVQHCLACHGPEGQGSADMFPPLAGTDWVTGSKSRLIRTLLLGLNEPIEVNGKTYEMEMPAYHMLSDQEIADILTYIRNSFGNRVVGVIPGEVYEERQSLKRQNIQY